MLRIYVFRKWFQTYLKFLKWENTMNLKETEKFNNGTFKKNYAVEEAIWECKNGM